MIEYYPLKRKTRKLDLNETYKDFDGFDNGKYSLRKAGDGYLIHAHWLVRPGKHDNEVIGYIPRFLVTDEIEKQWDREAGALAAYEAAAEELFKDDNS